MSDYTQLPQSHYPNNGEYPNNSSGHYTVAQAAAQVLYPRTSPNRNTINTHNNNTHQHEHDNHNHSDHSHSHGGQQGMNYPSMHHYSPPPPALNDPYYDSSHGHSHAPSNISKHVLHSEDDHSDCDSGHNHSHSQPHSRSAVHNSHASIDQHDDHHGHSHSDSHHGHAHTIIPNISLPKIGFSDLQHFFVELNKDSDSRRAGLYIAMKCGLMGFQLMLGLILMDMEIISSSFHTGFDIIALFCAIIAFFSARSKTPNAEYSYGYERFEVLSAFTNSVFLFFVAVFMGIETFHTYYNPPEADGQEVLLMGVSLVIDFIALALFFKFSQLSASTDSQFNSSTNIYQSSVSHSIHPSHRIGRGHYYNMHGLWLHAVVDSMIHIAFFIAIALTKTQGMQASFAICYAITSILIVRSCYPLFRAAGIVLLQTTDESIRPGLDRILREISFYDGVLECRSSHFWSITPGINVGSLHIRVRSDANEGAILHYVQNLLKKYVSDLTVQIEKDQPINWITGNQ